MCLLRRRVHGTNDPDPAGSRQRRASVEEVAGDRAGSLRGGTPPQCARIPAAGDKDRLDRALTAAFETRQGHRALLAYFCAGSSDPYRSGRFQGPCGAGSSTRSGHGGTRSPRLCRIGSRTWLRTTPAFRRPARVRRQLLWRPGASGRLCAICGSVQPQHLKEAACSRVPAAVIQRCKNCKKNKSKQIWVPWPEEVPEPLRGLSREIILALRPLEVDCGPEWKADYGYFFHSTMLRLAWSAQDVEAKIAGLDGAARRTAAKALPHLKLSLWVRLLGCSPCAGFRVPHAQRRL